MTFYVSRGLDTVTAQDIADAINSGSFSTMTFSGSVIFSSSVTFNNSATFSGTTFAINSANIFIGDQSTDEVFIQGHVRIYNTALTNYGSFSGSLLTGNRTFTFPDTGGTLALINVAQTFSNTQTFNDDVVLGSSGTDVITINGAPVFHATMQILDGVNFSLGITTGTKIGIGSTDKLSFYGASPLVQQTVTGSRGGNAALQSLLSKLSSLGLIVDSTTA